MLERETTVSEARMLDQQFHLPSLSVIIPAFNEERNIDEVLIRTYKALEPLCLPYEIILVDDGSTDRTAELASHHKVSLLKNDKNEGKGVALRRGISSATGDIVVTMDADGSHDPEDIPRLIMPVLDGATVALGTRFSTASGRRTTKRINLIGNIFFNLSITLMTGRRITDSQCGFRAFKRSFLKEIEISSDGFDVETEMLLKALRNGNIVKEVALRAQARGNGHSNVKILRDGMKIMKTIALSNAVYEQKED